MAFFELLCLLASLEVLSPPNTRVSLLPFPCTSVEEFSLGALTLLTDYIYSLCALSN